MNRSTRSRAAWSQVGPYAPSMTPRQAKGEPAAASLAKASASASQSAMAADALSARR